MSQVVLQAALQQLRDELNTPDLPVASFGDRTGRHPTGILAPPPIPTLYPLKKTTEEYQRYKEPTKDQIKIPHQCLKVLH